LIFFTSCDNFINRVPRVQEKINHDPYNGKVSKVIEYECNTYFIENENNIDINKRSCRLCAIYEYYPLLQIEKNWSGSNDIKKPDAIKTTSFNAFGHIVEESNKSVFPFAYESKSNYTYNESGFVVKQVSYYHGSFGNFYSNIETIYDEYNCPIKEIHYDSTHKITKYFINKFDKRNRQIKSSEFDSANVLRQEEVLKYKGDDTEWTTKYEYDNNGKLKYKSDRSNSENIFTKIFKSNSDDNYKNIEYYPNGKIKTKSYIDMGDVVYLTYDENERIIERKTYSNNNEWKETFTWKYREDGALLEESESTSKYTNIAYYKKTSYYKLDFNGNWIEKYTIDNENNVIELKVREFEYINSSF
jgi:hypothetical protein